MSRFTDLFQVSTLEPVVETVSEPVAETAPELSVKPISYFSVNPKKNKKYSKNK
jgi:hypothetical protein